MRIHFRLMIGLGFAISTIAAAWGTGLKSGLSIGEIAVPFRPTHVTGPDAGTNTCPLCKYGPVPAVQVWINGDKWENVEKIAETLEDQIAKAGPNRLKSFLVFIKPAGVSDRSEASQLKMLAAKCGLHNVGLVYVDGPSDDAVTRYKINTAASVKNTVVFYHDKTVCGNLVNVQGDGKGLASLKSALQKMP